MSGTGVAPVARRVGAALLDFLFPRACVSCLRALERSDLGVVCGRCWSRLATLPHPRCERCGHPLGVGECRWCAGLPPYVRAARSACWLGTGSAARIVHALKYGGWTAAADGMAARMARLAWPRDVIEERSALVPVPLAPVRQRERGFNQSALLAHRLSEAWHIPMQEGCLTRVRATRTQTRLTPAERRRNVSRAFRATPAAAELRGAHVVLVDDVVTTAATLSQCAGALFAAGARIISIVTFARAPAMGDRVSHRSDSRSWPFA